MAASQVSGGLTSMCEHRTETLGAERADFPINWDQPGISQHLVKASIHIT